MFTGLIEEIGTVAKLEREGTNLNFKIQASLVMDDIKLGDSIAIDGACQTVTKIDSDGFWVTAIAETLKLTNFGDYQEGTKVNLERCLRANDRFGGHIVAGHVDAVAKITDIKDLDGSKEFFVEVPEELSKYIIYKGSITMSGISLTIASIEANVFSVCIIPKTLEMTTLGILQVGDKVNIEPDMVAKYIEKFNLLNLKSN